MIVVGRVSGLHGVQGWVKVFSETSPRENILSYNPWYLRSPEGWNAYSVQAGRKQGKTLVAKLQGCNDREAARSLMGHEIAVERGQLGSYEARDGEYFWVDLEGLDVITTEGIELGRIDHLFQTGSNDVMVVKGERERLIPWLWRQVVEEVDLRQRRIVVDWDPEF